MHSFSQSRPHNSCYQLWQAFLLMVLKLPLSLIKIFEQSSKSHSQPLPAVSRNPPTRHLGEVLDKERPRRPGCLAERLVEAKAVAKSLGKKDSPWHWNGGHDGWFLGIRYLQVFEQKWGGGLRMTVVELRNWPVKISTLFPQEQLVAYQTLLKTARIDQVVAYYKLHCEKLDEVRCRLAHMQTSLKENKKRFRQVSPVFFSCREDMAVPIKVKKAAHAEQVAKREFRLRAEYRAYVRGLEGLIEKCEARLQEHGRRGWTGLRPEEVNVSTVDVAKGKRIGPRKMTKAEAKEILRASLTIKDGRKGKDGGQS